MKQARVLIITHSAALPTGLAETTRLIFETLLERFPGRYKVEQIGLVHALAVSVPKWTVHPTRVIQKFGGGVDLDPRDIHGQLTAPEVIKRYAPDIVFAFNDPQNVAFLCLPKAARTYRLVLHLNFDGYPFPVADAELFKNADLIVTSSRFSRDVLVAACPDLADTCHYLYSPADTGRFRPLPDCERQSLRDDLLPGWMPRDAFLIGWIGRNQWRKQIWLQFAVLHYLRTGAYLVCLGCGNVRLRSWDPSRQSHGDRSTESAREEQTPRCCVCSACGWQHAEPLPKVFSWLHMIEAPTEGDWPVRTLEQQFGLVVERDLHYTEGMGGHAALAPADIAALYQIWDCLLFLSGGEGFGLPAWEAMCAGLPVVYSDYSSHAEFVGLANGGLPVGGVLQPEMRSCVWRMIADTAQAVSAVRRLYYSQELRGGLGANGRKFTMQYETTTQASRWHALFESLLATGRTQTGSVHGPIPSEDA